MCKALQPACNVNFLWQSHHCTTSSCTLIKWTHKQPQVTQAQTTAAVAATKATPAYLWHLPLQQFDAQASCLQLH